ncbi:MAG: hypothetical protein HWD58_10965 [Bacteroidota bacterium]|nr:MAG: hypothetical protein HWD58_10965 [Bacteroidota bacterium]
MGNTYNGNLTFNVAGSGGLYTSYSVKSNITGNYTVNRTAAGLLDLLGTGVTIGGNFSCTKNVGGATLMGLLTQPSTIGGSININVTQNPGDAFRMYRIKNSGAGGSITVTNCQAPNIQQDSLVLNSFSINNYHSGAFAYFYDNNIQEISVPIRIKLSEVDMPVILEVIRLQVMLILPTKALEEESLMMQMQVAVAIHSLAM